MSTLYYSYGHLEGCRCRCKQHKRGKVESKDGPRHACQPLSWPETPIKFRLNLRVSAAALRSMLKTTFMMGRKFMISCYVCYRVGECMPLIIAVARAGLLDQDTLVT